MTDKTQERIYRSPKTGTCYSTYRIITPAGEMGWSDLNKPAPSYFDKDDPNAKVMFRTALLWYDPKALQEQQRAAEFITACEEFVKDCGVDPKKVKPPIQLKEGEDADGKPIQYKILRSEAWADRKPGLAKFKDGKAVLVEAASETTLNRGCVAAIKGRLRLSKYQGEYFLKVTLDNIIHIRDGKPTHASKAQEADIDVGDTKKFGDMAKYTEEDVEW